MTASIRRSSIGRRMYIGQDFDSFSHDEEYSSQEFEVKPAVVTGVSSTASIKQAQGFGKPKPKAKPKKKVGRPVGSTKSEEARIKELRVYQQRISEVYKNLRQNQVTSQIYYDDPKSGEEKLLADKGLSLIGVTCSIDHGKYVPNDQGRLLGLKLAQQNAYNPISEFLDKARACKPSKEAQEIVENLDLFVTGRKDDAAKKWLLRSLVGAVNRSFNPGASLPFMPILQGAQGVGKSGFIKALVPDTLRAEINSMPDQLLSDPVRMHVGWLVELPECDRMFHTKHIEDLKTIVTTDVDSTRKAYAELPTKLARRFLMIGTTNSKEFLIDTENRRFPIITIDDGHHIDYSLFKKYRLEIWHLILSKYEEGFSFIPSSEDLQELKKSQRTYQSRDPWAALIFRYILNKETVSAQAILESVIELNKKDMNTSHSRRVSRILTQFGWERMGVRKVQGVSVRLFRPGPTWDPSSIDI